jgi:hypothetical protein
VLALFPTDPPLDMKAKLVVFIVIRIGIFRPPAPRKVFAVDVQETFKFARLDTGLRSSDIAVKSIKFSTF